MPSQLENLNALKFSSNHLMNLINDILDFNKMISGSLRFDNSPFELDKVIEGISSSFSYVAKEKGVELVTEIAPCVPNSVSGDSVRLSQILSNLISNAIKFTENGTVTINVVCTQHDEETAKLRFSIIDTGIGIPEDKFDLIFERFTQAESDTTKKYGGTGLGLAICKKLLNLQDSNIYLESKEGEGTTFYFDLEFPKIKESEQVLNQVNSIQELDLKGMNILVVDDNPMNIMVVSQFLDKWEANIYEAGNGQAAIDLCKERDFDAILMDLQMPIKDGYQAATEIRSLGEKWKEVLIIALSASVSNEVNERIREYGMNDYISKPFDPIILFQKLSTSFQRPTSNQLVRQQLRSQ